LRRKPFNKPVAERRFSGPVRTFEDE